MPLALCPQPKLQFFGNDGLPLNGGYLYTYVAGAPSVPKATYSDAIGTANTNPIVLDSAGRAAVWLDGYYYMELWTGDKTVAGSTLVWTQDNVAAYSQSNVVVQRFDGDGNTKAFTLSSTVSTENDTMVFVEGVYQFKNTYTVSGTTLTFDVAPPSGTANVEVVLITRGFSTAVSILQDTGSAAPTTGTYPAGWVRWNSAPVAGENAGWICTVAGTPGTWKAFGLISL